MYKFTMMACALMAAGHSYALDIPNQSRFDSNIQHTRYEKEDVVAITAYTGMVTHIVLGEGEQVLGKWAGFSDGWSIETLENNVFIKPIAAKATQTDVEGKTTEIIIEPNASAWKTNLALVTNKRVYSFALELGEGKKGALQNTYRLTFDYSPNNTPKNNAKAPTQKSVKKPIESAIAQAKVFAPKNYNYVMQVGKQSNNIAPTGAYDDGRFTYFSFNADSEIPAIYVVDSNGKESLVNTHIDPKNLNQVVVNQTHKQWVLRLDNAVVGVTNQGQAIPVTETGASVSTVQRIIKDS
ncbi:P-type conjugative transfer protein VirB9 (plasmid) [Photobacterium damselae subsp. damselae]|uniref:P-type conjugative transfer protein VirB9 n=1 Tax=Photobacterium damselae TaxID=38293 RepID=UPI000A30076C|nr:P-type conjugative transfer protein VirB9 [Photobacterium damselae]ARR51783.1 P-type conjugative transfer protein VirB9 [Photobacterium damselae subsp. damselae]QAY37543.1 P-type conjugative transfer protein VirB9 [Photobacterium damselae subsp. damselae]